MKKLRIVKDDTPLITIALKDEVTGAPIDLSDAETVVRLKVRKAQAPALKGTVVCTKIAGIRDVLGVIDDAPPYNVAGSGGLAVASCPSSLFDESGLYEGEIEVTFGAVSRVSTVYTVQRFIVREDF